MVQSFHASFGTPSMNRGMKVRDFVRIGRLGRIGRLLAEQGMVRMIPSDPGMTRETLKADGLPVVEADVLSIELLDGMGNLALVGKALAAVEINIECGYATSAEIGKPGLLIVKTVNSQLALKILDGVHRSEF